MEKKITKKEVFNAVINMVNENEIKMVGDVPAEAVVETLTKAIEQLDKKAAKAAETRAKKAAKSDELVETIFNLITDEPQTGDDITAKIDIEGITVAKVRARLTKLVTNERIAKVPIKVTNEEGKTLKKMAYCLPTAEDAEDAEDETEVTE